MIEVAERLLESMMSVTMDVDAVQFGLVPDRSMTDEICIFSEILGNEKGSCNLCLFIWKRPVTELRS